MSRHNPPQSCRPCCSTKAGGDAKCRHHAATRTPAPAIPTGLPSRTRPRTRPSLRAPTLTSRGTLASGQGLQLSAGTPGMGRETEAAVAPCWCPGSCLGGRGEMPSRHTVHPACCPGHCRGRPRCLERERDALVPGYQVPPPFRAPEPCRRGEAAGTLSLPNSLAHRCSTMASDFISLSQGGHTVVPGERREEVMRSKLKKHRRAGLHTLSENTCPGVPGPSAAGPGRSRQLLSSGAQGWHGEGLPGPGSQPGATTRHGAWQAAC